MSTQQYISNKLESSGSYYEMHKKFKEMKLIKLSLNFTKKSLNKCNSSRLLP